MTVRTDQATAWATTGSTWPTSPARYGASVKKQELPQRGCRVGRDFGDGVEDVRDVASVWRREIIASLGTLPGFTDSRAIAINDAGMTFGDADQGEPTHAFVAMSGVVRDMYRRWEANSQSRVP
jgi:hypothetical protein